MSERILKEDWLTNYIKFTDNTESPKLYHLWVGLSAISSALQRKCWIEWGHETIYPNFYIVLVGPPGGRKGTAMKIAKNLVTELGITIASTSLGSPQAMYKELMEAKANFIDPDTEVPIEHRSLSVWSEEFQVFIGEGDQKFISDLTDLFDSPNVWDYRTLARGKEGIQNCWLNLIGATTPKLLQDKMSASVIGGGLISRIIFVVGYGKEKHIPYATLSEEEYQLGMDLMNDLEQIYHLKGPFQLTDRFIKAYSEWYINHSESSGMNSDKFIGYNARRAVHLRKLCMVVSAAFSNSMVITEKHFQTALDILEYTEYEMPNAFHGIGKGTHASLMADILAVLQVNRVMEFNALYANFHMDVLLQEFTQCIMALEKSGFIKEEISGSGRTFITYLDKEMTKKKETLDKTIFKYRT